MTSTEEEQQSIRDLILGVHDKLDAMRTSYRRILSDRLKDRALLQRHSRRIESLEHQVALLTAASSTISNWRPNPADLSTSEQVAMELEELALESEP